MSVHSLEKPITIQSLLQKKHQGEKIVSVTAYDYTTARLVDRVGLVDFMLVGDSLAMTVLGHPNTLSVTVDEMLHHVKAVVRGTQRALVVADMPFMSYTTEMVQSIRNAGRFIQEGGCHSVKIEGASPSTCALIEHLTGIGIPVMGHLGFTPQSLNTLGGFKVQGKTVQDAQSMVQDALALQRSGCYAVVLEMVPVEVAQYVSQALTIPTIGIGAGNVCDGQVLVIDDLLGRYPDLSPRFVRKYAELGHLTSEAIRAYAQDVQTCAFPDNTAEAFHFPAALQDELNVSVEASGLLTASVSS